MTEESTPDRMAALAANASAAFELLEDGVRTDSVLRGLAEGEELCAFMEKGVSARTKLESFSAAGLTAGEFVGLVLSTYHGKELVDQVPDVLEQLRALRTGLSRGIAPRSSADHLESLRDYFYRFTRALAQAQ